MALLALVIAIVILAANHAISRLYHGERDELRAMLQLMQRLEVNRKHLQAARDGLRTESAEMLRKHYFKGEEDNLILADLQSTLRAIITERKGELISVRNLPPHKEGDMHLLGLSLQMRADMPNVQSTLHAIESGSPYLWIKRLTLRVDENRGGLTGNQKSVVGFVVDLDVYGAKWRAPPESSDKAGKQ